MRRVVLISIDGLAAFYWDDPAVKAPTLRALASRGVVAGRMETVFPSTTWPTHATLVTGVRPARHGVVANRVLNRATGRAEDLTGDPIYDAADLLEVPTVYDVAHAAGIRTAAIDWPATRHAATLDFNLPFFKSQAVFETHTAPAVWAELRALGYPVDRQGPWAALPQRFLKDAMVADLAARVARSRAPGLLLVHFLCADSFQHLYGPRSPEAYWAIEYIDGLVGRFLGALPPGELDDRTTVFVVSDHGFLPVSREIRVNVHLRRLGLLAAEEGGGRGEGARFVVNSGVGWIYALGDGTPGAIVPELARELGTLPGVARVLTGDDCSGVGLPAPGQHRHLGDLMLEAEEGYAFAEDSAGDEVIGAPRHRGTHGQIPTRPDLGAFFLAAGAGVGRDRRIAGLASRDVAPTIAQVLGVTLPPGEGRVLTEIFD